MPEMSYNTTDLRTGGGHARDAASHGRSAAAALDVGTAASPFGDVSGSDAFHGAVQTARTHHQAGAQHGARNMTSAGQRATVTAALGDHNTVETTRVAPSSAAAGAVARGM